MSYLDLNKPVKLLQPLKGEENLIFEITNFNEVTNRCYIKPINPLKGINPELMPQELVSVSDLTNI